MAGIAGRDDFCSGEIAATISAPGAFEPARGFADGDSSGFCAAATTALAGLISMPRESLLWLDGAGVAAAITVFVGIAATRSAA